MDPNVLHNLSYGMYIVSSFKDKAYNGQIANTAFQITSEPPTIAISLNKKNLTHEYVDASKCFTLSVLNDKATLQFIGKFGFKTGRKEDKFKDVRFEVLASGCPVVLENTICYLEAEVINQFDCITHTLFFGRVAEMKMVEPGNPMTYDYYHTEIRGATPANAPTFIRGEKPVKR